MSAAIPSVMTTRTALPHARTWRRCQRSRNTPANGPTIVNGASITANAPAIAAAVPCDSGEKNSSDARPTWNMPSPACETRRTANSLRNPRSRSSARSSATTLTPQP